METNSIYREKFDKSKYDSLLTSDLDTMNDVKDPVEKVIPIIQQIFADLGDKHGGLFYKGKTFKGFQGQDKSSSLIKYALDEQFAFRTKIIDDKYSYVSIPSPQIPFDSFEDKDKAVTAISTMAQQIQDSLDALGNHATDHIILDLRLSLGGNLPILLASMQPLIGGNKVFDIAWADGRVTSFRFEDGNLYDGDNIVATTTNKCSFDQSKIAVLIGPLTNSASEQLAIAFKGKSNVKFIGENTAGYTTMTRLVRLNKDLIFTYSAGYLVGRDGLTHRQALVPDSVVIAGDNFESLSDDAKIKAAIGWFENKG
ncbi:MAG: S41 family peptidase [Sphingobacterium sp.]